MPPCAPAAAPSMRSKPGRPSAKAQQREELLVARWSGTGSRPSTATMFTARPCSAVSRPAVPPARARQVRRQIRRQIWRHQVRSGDGEVELPADACPTSDAGSAASWLIPLIQPTTSSIRLRTRWPATQPSWLIGRPSTPEPRRTPNVGTRPSTATCGMTRRVRRRRTKPATSVTLSAPKSAGPAPSCRPGRGPRVRPCRSPLLSQRITISHDRREVFSNLRKRDDFGPIRMLKF